MIDKIDDRIKIDTSQVPSSIKLAMPELPPIPDFRFQVPSTPLPPDINLPSIIMGQINIIKPITPPDEIYIEWDCRSKVEYRSIDDPFFTLYGAMNNGD